MAGVGAKREVGHRKRACLPFPYNPTFPLWLPHLGETRSRPLPSHYYPPAPPLALDILFWRTMALLSFWEPMEKSCCWQVGTMV